LAGFVKLISFLAYLITFISCVGSCGEIATKIWSWIMWSKRFLWHCRSVRAYSHFN